MVAVIKQVPQDLVDFLYQNGFGIREENLKKPLRGDLLEVVEDKEIQLGQRVGRELTLLPRTVDTTVIYSYCHDNYLSMSDLEVAMGSDLVTVRLPLRLGCESLMLGKYVAVHLFYQRCPVADGF